MPKIAGVKTKIAAYFWHMKLLALALFLCSMVPSESSFKEAMIQASSEDKPLLLIFSGSDWCRPCIAFKKDVLDAEAFKEYADASLVHFVADLPRNQALLSPAQLAENRELAAIYNPEGHFPQLILFKNGQVIKSKAGAFSTFNELKAWIESE
jgi:thioredoxin-related protein